MTFRIHRHEIGWYTGSEGFYPEGKRLNVEVSAMLGLSTKHAVLISLGNGEGFVAGEKVIRPRRMIWTDKGMAEAL